MPCIIALRAMASRTVRAEAQRTTNGTSAVAASCSLSVVRAVTPPGGPYPVLPLLTLAGPELSLPPPPPLPLPPPPFPDRHFAVTITSLAHGESNKTFLTSFSSHCVYGLSFQGSPAHTLAASRRMADRATSRFLMQLSSQVATLRSAASYSAASKPTTFFSPTTSVGVARLSCSSTSSRRNSASLRMSLSSKEIPRNERNSFAVAQAAQPGCEYRTTRAMLAESLRDESILTSLRGRAQRARSGRCARSPRRSR